MNLRVDNNDSIILILSSRESEPNILHPELLQIPHGTVVVLNETNIAPGELNQYGE